MRELEARFPDRLAVVGVHTGKYIAERDTARIRDATQRLDVAHPVINDRQYRVWRSFAIRAWPSLVVVDPTGSVLGSHAGEFTAEMLAPLIERLIETHGGAAQGERASFHFPRDRGTIEPGVLRYPGKVAVDGDRMAIADTGHHRVLVGRLTAGGGNVAGPKSANPETPIRSPQFVVTHVFGDGRAGFVDGTAPRFSAPNGLAFAGGTLYVADTENHAIRAVDLAAGSVHTVAGTGEQLRSRRQRAEGALSSPWDVAMVGGLSYIAMAGTHQLWALGQGPTPGRAVPVAGTGGEDIADGPAGDALLAQPMGLAAAADGRRVYFVDAESSAVRWLDTNPRGTGSSDRAPGRAGNAPTDAVGAGGGDGAVHTIVGTGLFDFGDQDGIGDAVRMQHPQGVAWHPSGRLLVADSYNDALKWVDPASREVSTVVRGLHEPGGLVYDEQLELVYVADTNAHRIGVIDVVARTRGVLDIVGASPPTS